MAHLQYMPGDPRLVDQLVYELKSKGIFDQFRKECIADVDTRPAYQNLRQRVEGSVSTFLSRQHWTPDMNKNQLREKLRKSILDGNYLEQGLERIVDQVVNPKVASVFKPQVEDLVYNYLGIARKKAPVVPETTNIKLLPEDLLPTDLEAVSPGSVKSDDDKELEKSSDIKDGTKMEIDEVIKSGAEDNSDIDMAKSEKTEGDTQLSGISVLTIHDNEDSLDKSNIPLPAEEINPENIPPPENSPPKAVKVELEKIELPREPNLSTDIPLPDEILKGEKEHYFKPINSEEDSSSDSSLRRNMSPLTPIRNFNNENSCDAQQAFENISNDKSEVTKEPSSFRFTIEKTQVNSTSEVKTEKKDSEQAALSYQFSNQVNLNTFNTPIYDDSSNSNNLRIDYESDANSKNNVENKHGEVVASQNNQPGEEHKNKQKNEERRSSHKSSHHSRDSHRHSSSSKDKRSDSKHSSSKDRKDSKNEKKVLKDEPSKSKSSHSDKPKDNRDKKNSRDSSKQRSSSHKSSSHKDSKSHRSSSTSSSHRHSSKHSDDKKTSSSSQKDKSDKSSDKSSKDKCSKDTKPTHRSDKEKKSSNTKVKQDEKEKKDKKDTDDHYSLSGRGNPNRRSTDRDSNDGSSSSKGSQNQPNSKSSENKTTKGSSSKSENTSTSNDSTSPSDNDHVVNETTSETKNAFLPKPVIRIESHLETPVTKVPHLPFVPDVTLKKPKFAANLAEAKRLMKMRRFLAEEQRRMNQEAALLLEFQANVRPSLSQVYSSIPGPELEFICGSNLNDSTQQIQFIHENHSVPETGVKINKHEATECIIIDDHNDIHKEITQSNNYEITSPSSPIKHENTVCDDVTEPKHCITLDESLFTPTMELTRDKINEIIGVENFPEYSKSDEEGEPCEVNYKHESRYENVTKINMTLEDPDIHIFNKEEFTKEKINEIIGVEAFVNNMMVENNNVIDSESKDTDSVLIYDSDGDHKKRFEVTIINETVDDSNNCNILNSNEGTPDFSININDNNDEIIDLDSINYKKESEKTENIEVTDSEVDNRKRTGFFEVTIITEEVSEDKEFDEEFSEITTFVEEKPLEYFGEQEKFNAEIEKEKFVNFLKSFKSENGANNKIYLINCDTYENNVLKEVSKNFGCFEIVNYHKNGCLKLPKAKKSIIKNVKMNTEMLVPVVPVENNINDYDCREINSPLLSPTKSEYSFDLPTDYNAKLDEMMKKASKRDIMEIILGIPEESSSKAPSLDNSNSNLESESRDLKRKLFEMDVIDNNNKNILTPNKIRKLSGNEQISSTTEETEGIIQNRSNNTRSKYLGKAKRVGLPRPRRCTLPNSPSSDKSVENYEQNSIKQTPNGKLKVTPRSKVQRYDTSDLYKPKLHYLSRRNNVT